MTDQFDLSEQAMVALMRDSLTALRVALFRDVGAGAAGYLQESGYAGGAALYDGFAHWLARQGLGAPHTLGPREFALRAESYFRDLGWGSLTVTPLNDAVVAIDSVDWAEADPGHPLDFPGCHVTTGMFADFFGRLAGSPLAVMEVECRSSGAPRCRFLLGSAEVMQHVYDEMGRGIDYEAAAATL